MKHMTHEEVMKMIESIPSVKKHNDRPETKVSREIMIKRIYDLHIDQYEAVEKLRSTGYEISVDDYLLVEDSDHSISLDTLQEILKRLSL